MDHQCYISEIKKLFIQTSRVLDVLVEVRLVGIILILRTVAGISVIQTRLLNYTYISPVPTVHPKCRYDKD